MPSVLPGHTRSAPAAGNCEAGGEGEDGEDDDADNDGDEEGETSPAKKAGQQLPSFGSAALGSSSSQEALCLTSPLQALSESA